MTPEDLVDIEAIKQLKYRYARLLDTKRWDELGALFVPDATASYSGGQLSLQGREAIVMFLRDALGSTQVLTRHTMSQPEIELLSAERARGVWALSDVVVFTEGAFEVRGASFYSDEYVKADGSWLFGHTGYKRVYEEMAPRAPEVRLTASWFETDGKSQLVEG